MNTEKIIEYIYNPEKLDQESTKLFHDLIEQYPYFQTAHLLYLKSLKKHKHIQFESQLKKSSVFISDRKKLYGLLNLKQETNVSEELINQQIKKLTSLSDEEIPVQKPFINNEKDEKEKLEKLKVEEIKKAEDEKLKKLQEEEIKKAEDEKLKKLQEEKIKKAEEEKLKKLQEEKTKKAEEEKLKKLQEEKTKKAEEEKLKKLQEEEIKKAEDEKLKKLQEEKIKKAEEEKLKKLQEEKIKKAEEEKLKKLQEEKTKKAEDEKLKKLQEDRLKPESLAEKVLRNVDNIQKDRQSKSSNIADIILNKYRKQQDINKEEKPVLKESAIKKGVEEEKLKKLQEEKIKKAQDEKLKKLQEEKIKKAEDEKLKKLQEEETKKAEDKKLKKLQEEETKKAEDEKLKKLQEEETKKAEDEKLKKLQEEETKKAEDEKLKKLEDEEYVENEPIDELNDLISSGADYFELLDFDDNEPDSSQENAEIEIEQNKKEKEFTFAEWLAYTSKGKNQVSDLKSNRRPPVFAQTDNSESNEDISVSSVEESDDFVTETLADIYIQQKYFDKAISAFEKLSLKYPEKSIYFAGRIKNAKKLIKNKKV